PIGCPIGTRVRVSRLFARAPVRLNALRSISRELKQIHELVAQTGIAVMFITHDMSIVGNLCDRIAVFYGGHVVEIGPKAQIF
ncbi:ABC transporter ATP-binding protein, partial [Candidatus Entotheonella serta]